VIRLAGLLLFAATAPAQTIPGIPGLTPTGGGEAKEPAVRLADDPRSKVARLKKAVMEARQGLVLRAQDAQRWEKRRTEVRGRRVALVTLRRSLVSDTEPSEADRRLADAPEPPEPDAGPPDAGPADGGVTDGGVTDGGVADGETSDAGVADAAPPPIVGPTMLPVLQVGELFLRPRVHPAQIAELDRLAEGLDDLEETLSALMRLYAEERGLLTEALAQADQLLKAIDTRAGEQTGGRRFFGLRAVEKLALEAHLATIELSLARARARQATADPTEAAKADAGKELESVMPLDSGGATPLVEFAASHREAEVLRDQLDRLHRDKAEIARDMGDLREDTVRARTLRFQLALIAAERDLEEREETLRRGLDRLAITPDEVKWATKKYERSVELRGASIPRIEAKRDELRAALAASGTGPFSLSAVAEAQDVLYAERIVFERLKLQRDAFRNDLIHILEAALDGVPPPDDFLQKYRLCLDEGAHRGRSDDLATRCDGWRRAENTVKRAPAPPEVAARKKQVLAAYAALQDVCMREEWVLATQDRLADIGRYHFEKLKWESRSAGWYAWRVLLSLIFAVIAFVLSQVVGRVTHRLAGHDREDAPAGPSGWAAPETGGGWSQRILRLRRGLALLVYLGAAGLVWLYAAVWCINYVWELPIEVGRLLGWATIPLFLIGDRGVSIWSMAQIAVWGVAAVWTGRLLRRWISDNLLQHFSVERGVRDAVGTMIGYLVMLVGIGAGLASVGIGVGAMAVVFGVVGIGIGFGLRDIANNFISGFILLLERPIRKGDFIQVDDLVGQVREISARATTIETRDAVTVIVPNSQFITGNIVNMTLGHNERVRTQVRVGVAYGSDVAKVQEVLLDVAKHHGGVLSRPPPKVHFKEFDESALAFVLHVWTERIRALPDLVSDLNMAVDAAFREHGITVPFPQRTVHLHDVELEEEE